MSMETERLNVSENYDAVASAYAENLYDELVAKPLDRHLLSRFAEGVRDRGTIADIPAAFREFRRVLTNDGALLVAFHIGDHVHHVDEMWGQPVSLDFHFLKPGDVASALESAGFVVAEATEREPYEGAEHPSRRCPYSRGTNPRS